MWSKSRTVAASVFVFLLLFSSLATASGHKAKEDKNAIIIASFGTTVPSAVQSITNIVNHVKKAYPDTEVRVTFTSNIIRSVWRKRRAEPQKWLDKGIPREILYVKNIIQTFGDLREEGYNNIVVQPTHMFYMEQAQDLKSYVNAMASIETTKAKWKPFSKIVMGRPALGMPGDLYSYHEDLAEAVGTLADDVKIAEKEGAVLLYMGHGNEHWSSGIYAEFQKKMNKVYPQVKTLIGVVEGMPTIEDVIVQLKHAKTDKIVLRPFMIVAGDHATNDMAGDEGDSWKSILTAKGYKVQCILKGLGSNDEFASLFVERIADAAEEKGIALK
jgi:sirohydrochlorin cobaltochelatase